MPSIPVVLYPNILIQVKLVQNLPFKVRLRPYPTALITPLPPGTISLGTLYASNSVIVGNSTVNSTINSTAFSGTANNSIHFDGLTLVTVQGQITGNADTAYANAVVFASNATNITTGTLDYPRLPANVVIWSNTNIFTAEQTFNANVTIGDITVNTQINSTSIAVKSIIANGESGTSGQILTSNGTGIYWSTASAPFSNGISYVWSAPQTFNENVFVSNATLSIGNSSVNTTINSTAFTGQEGFFTGNVTANNANTTNNLSVGGDLTVAGNVFITGGIVSLLGNTAAFVDNMLYLNQGIQATITNISGSGTVVTFTANNNYQPGWDVFVSGVNPTSYNGNYLNILAANATHFQVSNTNTAAYVSGGTARGKTDLNPDIGLAAGYNDGTYHHTGIFRDASDGFWKVFDNYGPEPDNSLFIDTNDPTFNIAGFWSKELRLGNTTVYSTVNTTIYSGTANNANNLGGSSLATIQGQITGNAATAYSNAVADAATSAAGIYQTTAGLAANVLTLTANDANRLGTQLPSYYTNATNITTGTLAFARLPANIVFWSNTNTFTARQTMNANLNVNSATFAVGNTIANVTVNTTVIVVGNSTVNASINSTAFSGTANDSTNLNGQPGSYYTNADNISTGTVATARLASGTADGTTFLRGDQVWTAISANPAGSNTYIQFNDSGSFGSDPNFKFEVDTLTLLVGPNIITNAFTYIANSLTVENKISIGNVNAGFNFGSLAQIEIDSNQDTYSQIVLQNGNTGVNASGDLVVTADNGNDTTNYIDLGISSSIYSNTDFALHGFLDGYLYTSNSHLVVGTAINKEVIFHANGFALTDRKLTINATAVTIANNIALVANASNGTSGQVLTSTGTGIYWSTPTGSFSNGTAYTWSAVQTYTANISLTGSPTNLIVIGGNTVNSTVWSGSATYFGDQLPAFYTNATNIITGTLAVARLPANIVFWSNTNTFSAVQTFNQNVFTNSATLSVGNTTANVTVNTTHIVVGNGSVNATINSTAFSGTATNITGILNYTSLPANVVIWSNTNTFSAVQVFNQNVVVNTAILAVGNTTANVTTNTTHIVVGNSSVNVSINSTAFSGTSANATNLNGQPGSYYTNATNLATGTVPTARLATSGTPSSTTFLRGDQVWATPPGGGSGSPGGSTGDIQFNDAGSFAGNSNFTYDQAAVLLTVGNTTVNTQINSTSIALRTLIANGGVGSAGQVLTSSGSGANIYWSTPTGGGGGLSDSYETVNKNLKAYDAVFVYSSGILQTITYTIPPSSSIVKTFNYTGGVLTSIVLSGATPGGIDLTKTFGYTGEALTSITYS